MREPVDIQQWLTEHRVEEVEAVVADLGGVARGKAMPARKFVGSKASFLPVSIFFQSITGAYAQFERHDFHTENDLHLVPVLGSARLVPWASAPTAVIIHDLMNADGSLAECAPRNVLKRVLSFYERQGWQPIVAPEMEFYLTKKNTDPDYPLEPPIGRSGRQSVGRQSFSIAAVDEYEPIIELIYDYAEVQRLEIDTVIHEAGAAQLEINLMHGDPLELADQAFLFKCLVREAAFRHDCYATFMARPMDDEPGSAMHLHQSVVSLDDGRNLFSKSDGQASAAFAHFIGGQQKYLPAVTPLMAPYVNSYRRLVPGDSAPINIEWGQDNRSVGLRIPQSESDARRLENRIAGADANPYLAIAGSLAAGYLGLVEEVTPRAEVCGDAYNMPRELPNSLHGALTSLLGAPQLHEILGPDFVDVYATVKAHEFEEFMRVVTPWEREHLLLTV